MLTWNASAVNCKRCYRKLEASIARFASLVIYMFTGVARLHIPVKVVHTDYNIIVCVHVYTEEHVDIYIYIYLYFILA